MSKTRKKKPTLLKANVGAVELSAGSVKLAKREGPMLKKALLCRTGCFEGMSGPIEVTQIMLVQIAERYNRERATPQNENDYSPILLDHNRMVDLIKGRLMAGLEVLPFADPADGSAQYGLFGDLRVDDEEAQTKVDKGQYAHLSISFDDETFEFFEVSFVAVEAARRSIVLSQTKKGDTDMKFQQKFTALSQRHKSLATLASENRKSRKVKLAALSQERTELEVQVTELQAKAAGIQLTFKAGQLKAQLGAFVAAGKMNPVELKDMDFKALAAMPPVALAALTKSYETRPVSTDVFQIGQQSANSETQQVKLTPEKMREAIALQKSGKKAVKLSVEAPPAGDLPPVKKEGEEQAAAHQFGAEEYSACLAEIDEVTGKLSSLFEKIKAVGKKADELSADDDKQEQDENKLAAEDKSDDEDDKEEK